MTYHHIRTPAQHFTPGADEKRANCDGRWDLYWALIDNPRDGALAREAADICRTCPLASSCLTAKKDPHWAAAAFSILQVIANPSSPKAAPAIGNRQGFNAAAYISRLQSLEALTESGANVATAASSLCIDRRTLYRWCHRHGHLDLWEKLLGKVAA